MHGGEGNNWRLRPPQVRFELKGKSMKALISRMHAFLVNEDGPTATEYAVMLALIIVVCMVAISALSTSLQGVFTGIAGELDGVAPGA
jgi:pilus assembly protein Flp/PilA